MGTDYSYADYEKFPDPSHRPIYLPKLDRHLKASQAQCAEASE